MAFIRARDEHELGLLKQRMIRFKKSYSSWKRPADRFRKELEAILSQLMKENELVPAVLESRIKPLASAVPEVEYLPIDNVFGLDDFVRLRLVFLLTNEVTKAVQVIRNNFDIDPPVNVGDRLKFNEFGYRAIHISAKLPAHNPSYSKFGQFKFEIQLRTLSQHNYAVASRVLQYKQTETVPPSVQRSLLRLAAILEIVDLEVHRIYQDKLAYSTAAISDLKPEEPLNVDLIIQILECNLPKEYRVLDDRYTDLFDDLTRNDINTAGQLLDLIEDFSEAAIAHNTEVAESFVKGDPSYFGNIERAKAGVFYSQVGLVTNMLALKRSRA